MSDKDYLIELSRNLDKCADLVIDDVMPRRLLSQYPKSDIKEVCIQWAETVSGILEARRRVDKLLNALVK